MKLQMVNVTRKFGNFRAVENLNLTIENGVYGLLGVNGAGKTTLMRMICTLLPPTSGQILCDGKDIFKMDGEYRNLLGYLPQEFGFYPDFTVKDYLLYIASLKGIRPMVAGKRVKDLLAQVGLTKSANKKMKKLSGGMKRRAGIAQAMLNNPKILILDEPTAGLDPTERVRFRNLISELSEDRIVILSTHIVSDVEYIANEIWLMKDGQIMQQGNLDQTLASMQEKVFCLFLSMLVSAKTHTAVVAVTIPFAILFLPLFVSNFDFLSGILGVFPDRLLQINEIINTFDLYHIGGKIVGSIPIMLVIYPILSILMVPLMYHIYHKTEIK